MIWCMIFPCMLQERSFLVVNSHTCNIPEHVRHLSVVENDSLSHALFPKSRNVRTILFPIVGMGVGSEALLDTLKTSYKNLRVLDLSDSPFESLPNSIAKLEHLRALTVANNCKIKRLPHPICKLQNLEILSLRGCKELETLPRGFGMLISLRKFYITTKQSIFKITQSWNFDFWIWWQFDVFQMQTWIRLRLRNNTKMLCRHGDCNVKHYHVWNRWPWNFKYYVVAKIKIYGESLAQFLWIIGVSPVAYTFVRVNWVEQCKCWRTWKSQDWCRIAVVKCSETFSSIRYYC